MGEGFQFIDLIFYAMIAVFLILRLRSVLGRRTGHEQQRPFGIDPAEPERAERDSDNVIELPVRPQTPLPQAANAAPLEAALVQIQIADQNFSVDSFLMGARSAFEIIIAAFAAGDRKTLRPLLSDAVFNDFTQAIEARAQGGETVEHQLLGAPTVEITAAEIQARTAFITVRFVSEQVNLTRGRDGQLVEGDPNHVTMVVDLWTFSRDTRSGDPNWTLVETRSGD